MAMKMNIRTFVSLLKALIFLSLGLTYLFWSFDVLHDTLLPVIGWTDDAIVLLIVAWVIRGDLRNIVKWAKKVW